MGDQREYVAFHHENGYFDAMSDSGGKLLMPLLAAQRRFEPISLLGAR